MSDSVRRPRPHCRRAENTTPNGSKARRICPGDSGHGRPPLHLEIVDCPPADEAADASFATDQPSKARAERHWVVADIAALGAPSRMRAVIPQSRRHSTAISASSRGIWRTCAPLVTLREPYLPSVSAAACAFAGIAILTRSDTWISPSQCCQQTPHEWAAAGTLLATRRDRASAIFRDNPVKNPLESVHRKIKLVMSPPAQARPSD